MLLEERSNTPLFVDQMGFRKKVGSKTAVLVFGDGFPEGFDLAAAQGNWLKEDYELRAVIVGDRSYPNVAAEVRGEVGSALKRSSDVVVLGTQYSAPYAVEMHSVFTRDMLTESGKILTAVTLSPNMDPDTETNDAKGDAMRSLKAQLSAGKLIINGENTFHITDRKSSGITSIPGASIIQSPQKIEGDIAAALTTWNIPGAIRESRMRMAQRM